MEIYYAKIGLDNIVIDVIKVSPVDAISPETGLFDNDKAIDFLQRTTGHEAWVHYDAEANGIKPYTAGSKWDSTNQIFIQSDIEKPFESWVMNTTTGLWEAPVALPEDGARDGFSRNEGAVRYGWDEENGAWVAADIQGAVE